MTDLTVANDINLNSVSINPDVGYGYHTWYQWPYYTPPGNINVFYPWPLAPTPRCAWCQGQHIGSCPRLKSLTYRKDGTVERVEFFEED
jgi:hypothetical protein